MCSMEGNQAPELRPKPNDYLTDGRHALYRFEQYLGDGGVLLETVNGELVSWDIEEFLASGLRVLDRLQRGVAA
jgi:hypothetical protein